MIFRINNYFCPCDIVTLLKKMTEGREDEEEDVSIYWMTVRIEEMRRFWKPKEETLDDTVWRNGFSRGYGLVVRENTWW